MPYPKKNTSGEVDTSSLVQKSSNLSDIADKTQALSNLGAKARTDVDGLETFAALRTRKPAYEGETVVIKCHTKAVNDTFPLEGGGRFIGRLTAQADDGGYIASAGDAWHWVRDKPIKDLYIGDFGGVADGVTDAQPAFQKYIDFMHSDYARRRTGATVSGSTVSGGYSPYIGIKFGAGTYYITPGEYNKYGAVAWSDEQKALNPSGYQAAGGVCIEGVGVSFGRLIATKIISDKTDKPVFLINHRRFDVKNIFWDGQQSTARNAYNASTNPTGTNLVTGATSVTDQVNYVSNKQPFLKNECPGGCYMYLGNLQISNIGGYAFYVLDTLDSIIEQVYGSNTAAPVFQGGWSDPAGIYTGVWDHATSLEIRNCNFGSCMGPAIWAPRCGQSLMRNCWFEHGTVPFDVNNGQWDMDMICIEDCVKNATAWNCKLSVRTLSVPTGNTIETDSPTSGNWNSYTANPDGSALTAWSEAYGQGNYQLMNYAAVFNCPVVTQWDRGVLRGTNNTDSSLWVNIGEFVNPAIGQWEIEIVGGAYYNTSTTQNMLTDRLQGKAVLNIGRGTGSTPKTTFYVSGYGPLAAAPQYATQQYNTTIPAVWVCIRPRVGEFTVFVKSTGMTRRESGTPSKFTPNGATQTTNPGLNAFVAGFSFNNLKAGFGARDDVVEITSRLTAGANGASGTPATDEQLGNEPVYPNVVRYMRMSVGGQELAIPVFAWKPVFTTSNPATLSVATGGTMTLTAVVTDAQSQQWQFSTDGTTWTNISGATTQTLTKTGIAAADAGQYRLAVRSNNGSGGQGITTYGSVTTVTVT